ncbi:GSCFA domain-containing protein [uncultured Pelagimonas sp.]|uniref:GSCFA domain-containing protein n=1 Tax=uncultured Pelagimonas sp. TaxID=1618102 RepID=UPI002602C15F|nr:GSCFA domain-containing protein [uncultured Pelagimonas sp.]
MTDAVATSPYQNLDSRSYWRSGVAERSLHSTSGLYVPRFRISRKAKIMTAGSCFAQHVGRTLKAAGFRILDAEPGANVPARVLHKYGFGLYSARYGNVYTARQMAQLLAEAFDGLTPSDSIWERNGRFYDAFRPSVEPNGHLTPQDVVRHRQGHLAAVRELITTLDVFVFTFGLTEAWVSTEDGTVYPTAPGTISGSYDPEKCVFHNFRYNEVLNDFRAVRKRIRSYNPRAKFIVTVSPVPLTATATGQHVEVASSYSKSVLRSVCGTLYEDYKDVDYFPSYEVITSQTARGENFKANWRSVTSEGVSRAMGLFMQAHDPEYKLEKEDPKPEPESFESALVKSEDDDLVCEEALLEAFSK